MKHNKIKLNTYSQNFLYDDLYNEICGIKFDDIDITVIKTSNPDDVRLHERFYTFVVNQRISKFGDLLLHDIRQHIFNMRGMVELFKVYFSKHVKPPFIVEYDKNKKQLAPPGFFVIITYHDKETKEDFYKIGYVDYSDIGYLLDIRFLNSEFSKKNIKSIQMTNIDSDNKSCTIEVRKTIFTDEEIFNDKNIILRQKSSLFYLLSKFKIDNNKYMVDGVYFSYYGDNNVWTKDYFYYDEEYDVSGRLLSHMLSDIFFCKHLTSFA